MELFRLQMVLFLCIVAGFLSALICEGVFYKSPRNFFIWFLMTLTAIIVGSRL